MMKNSDNKYKTRQQQILLGAMKVLRTKKFHAASMREIAAASGMSLGNLYNYIEKKEDILFLIHERMFERINQRFDDILKTCTEPEEQLTTAIRELFYLACEMKEEALIILTEAKSLERKNLRDVLHRESDVVGIFESIISRGVRQGVFRCEKPKLIANLIASDLWIIPLRGWSILPHYTEEEVLEQVVHCHLKELKKRS